MNRNGFTLIELSIVLVIIGLIVGGVLVGQDLIEAAKTRATISQLEKYKAAVFTFKGKYQSIPGDMVTAQATAFDFAPTTRATTIPGFLYIPGNGNIDGLPLRLRNYENLLLWQDLSSANLIEGNFSAITDMDVSPLPNKPATYVDSYRPRAKIDTAVWLAGAIILTGNVYSQNSFMLTQRVGTGEGVFTVTDFGGYKALTPLQAFAIETKLDDGHPFTGTVIQVSPVSAPNMYIGNTVPCLNVSTNEYDLITYANTPYCSLGFLHSF